MDADGPALVETGGALNVRYRGRLLYSERGPALIPGRAALACELGPARLYLVSSPCLWYGIPELLARLEPGSAVLCLEADEALARLSLERAPAGLLDDPRLAFLPSADPAKALEAAAALGSFRRCVPLRLSGGDAFHADEYRRAAAVLQAEFAAAWRNRAALLSMGRLWARNIFRNLASLREIGPEAPPRCEGAAFVCGAGPSLEASLPLIAARRGRLALIACDTALPVLLGAGLEPDLVVCLEGQAHNLADFTPAGGREIPLLADLSSHPATFRALRGRKHLSLVHIAPGAFMRRVSGLGLPCVELPPLGSVGVHAVHLARKLASGPVLAAGLDFSYELGKTHARGAPALLSEERRMTRLYRSRAQLAAAFKPGARPAPGAGAAVRATAVTTTVAADGASGQAPAPGARAGAPLTDPVLSSYAALLAEENAGPGPLILDLRGRGLPIGGRPTSLDEADRLLAALEPSGRGAGDRPGSGSGTGETAAARAAAAAAESATSLAVCDAPAARAAAGAADRAEAFLAEEADRLERTREALRGGSGRGGGELAALVAGSDYLLWPFPDADRFGGLPQDLLNRLLVEVEYWRWKLGEIRAGSRAFRSRGPSGD